MQVENIDEKTNRRLNSAWSSILSRDCNFFNKSKENSLKEGEGFSIYKFLRPDNTRDYNCEYYYVEKGSTPYNVVISSFDKKDDFLKVYNYEKNFAICVCVPEYETGEETVQQIRLFNFSDLKEENY